MSCSMLRSQHCSDSVFFWGGGGGGGGEVLDPNSSSDTSVATCALHFGYLICNLRKSL